MCVNCMTSAESLALGLPMAGAVGREMWRRVTGRRDRLAEWDADAAFLAGMGHDPEQLLGARPADRVDA